MSVLDGIRAAISASRYRITRHAAVEMQDDAIDVPELLAATRAGEVIEDYPGARPYPACLVLGYATPDRPVHAVWAFDAASAHAILITTYRPDPARWSPDFRSRVKR